MLTHFVFEDPWGVLGVLAVLTVLSLIALWMTQLTKYLWAAVGLIAFGVAVAGLDWYVVTDREKVEAIVEEMADAVRRSDPDGVIKHLDLDGDGANKPSVAILGLSLKETAAKGLIVNALGAFEFDILRISGMDAKVLPYSRTAEANFQVFAAASTASPGAGGRMGIGSLNSNWSIGFHETEPGTWKVTSIATSGEYAGEILKHLLRFR